MEGLINFLTKYYFVCALATLSLFTIFGLSLFSTLDSQTKISNTISLINKQKMLSQKISSLSSQHYLRIKGSLEELKSAVEEFKTNDNKLFQIYNSGLVPQSNLKKIYSASGLSFKNQVEMFLENLDVFLKTPLKLKKSVIYYNKVISQVNLKILEPLTLLEEEYQKSINLKKSLIKLLMLFVFFIVSSLVFIYTFLILRPIMLKLQASEKIIEEIEYKDLLTKLANRKEFVRRGEIEVYKSRRYSRSMSILLIDIDHFKNFNEKNGHVLGDKLLTAFADCLTQNIRTIDIAGRINGGEFAVLLPETNLAQAILLGDRLRGIIAAENILKIESKNLNITVSIGVTEVQLSNDKNSIEKALKDASANLFFAKQAGRNKIIPEAA